MQEKASLQRGLLEETVPSTIEAILSIRELFAQVVQYLWDSHTTLDTNTRITSLINNNRARFVTATTSKTELNMNNYWSKTQLEWVATNFLLIKIIKTELIRRDSRRILYLQKFQCRKFLDKVIMNFESKTHSMKIDKIWSNHESLLSTKDKPLQIMIIIHSCMEIHFRFSTIRIQITNILSRECKYHHKFRWRRKIYQKTSVTWPFSLLVLCTHSHLIFLLIQSSKDKVNIIKTSKVSFS